MPLEIPSVDPTPIFEIYRGNYATELLTAAVAHLHVFEVLDDRPMSIADLQNRLGLADRPCHVLVTALCAFGMLRKQNDRLELTGVAREHLLPGAPFDVSGYVGLAADNPGVREMVERLRSNRPAGPTMSRRSWPSASSWIPLACCSMSAAAAAFTASPAYNRIRN